MDVQKLGKELRVRREFLKLRQEDLAEMSGVATKTIQLIEHGTGNPSLRTLEKVTKILGLSFHIMILDLNNESK
jgi:transcriptional regulator with XRE-family HTH domain